MQHCSMCGAENETDAQFCAECGSPLDVETPTEAPYEDETIPSSSVRDRIEAQTTDVLPQVQPDDEAQEATVIADAVEVEPESPPETPPVDEPEASSEPEPIIIEAEPLVSEPPADIPPEGNNDNHDDQGQDGFWSQRNIIIAVAVLLLLLCCCCVALIGGGAAAYMEELEDLLEVQRIITASLEIGV